MGIEITTEQMLQAQSQGKTIYIIVDGDVFNLATTTEKER